MNCSDNISGKRQYQPAPDFLNLGKIFVLRKDFIQPDSKNSVLGNGSTPVSLRSECVKIFGKLISFVLLILIPGCSDGIKTDQVKKVVNMNFAEPTELKMEEVFKLDSSDVNYPIDIKFDNSGNLYLVEYNSSSIKIFDNNGTKINQLESDSKIVFFDLENDTVFTSLQKENSVRSTDLSGNTIRESYLDKDIPVKTQHLGPGRILGTFRKNKTEKSDTFTEINLKVTGTDYDEIETLSSYSESVFTGNMDLEIPVFPFTVNGKDNRVYIGNSSGKYYRFYIFDPDMNLISVIDNKVPSVIISDKELTRRKELAKKFRIPLNLKKGEKDFIESMQTDESGNLWIRRASDFDRFGSEACLYDIFRSDGKYVRTYLIRGTSRAGSEILHNGLLYIIRPLESRVTAYRIDMPVSGGTK